MITRLGFSWILRPQTSHRKFWHAPERLFIVVLVFIVVEDEALTTMVTRHGKRSQKDQKRCELPIWQENRRASLSR
jgi:hypothetical protein